jgi:hypothetical protein
MRQTDQGRGSQDTTGKPVVLMVFLEANYPEITILLFISPYKSTSYVSRGEMPPLPYPTRPYLWYSWHPSTTLEDIALWTLGTLLLLYDTVSIKLIDAIP